MTCDLWLLNNAQLLEKSNEFFKLLLTDIASSKHVPIKEGVRLHGERLLKIDTFFSIDKVLSYNTYSHSL